MNVGHQPSSGALGNPLPPISNIPLEILATIFQSVVQSDNHALHTPVHLAIVCRKWRDIIYSHPQLWAVCNCSTYEKSTGDLVPHLKRWFQRAGTLPLTLKLTMTPTRPTAAELPALTEILSQNTRWRSLHLKLVPDPGNGAAMKWVWLDRLFNAVGAVLRKEGTSSWEILQELEIEAMDTQLQEFVRLPFAKIAPNLRQLKISFLQIPNAYRLVEGFVNLKKIRHLEVNALINWKDQILPTFYYHTLAEATNLDALKVLDKYDPLGIVDFTPSEIVPSFPVSNHTLTKLTVHDNRATRNCLPNLCLPALTTLTLIGLPTSLMLSYPVLDLSGVVMQLITKSDCKLKHVRLENTPSLLDCVPLMRVLSSVQDLELHFSKLHIAPIGIRGRLAELLEETVEKPDPILPNLVSFTVGWNGSMTQEVRQMFTLFVEDPRRWPLSEGATADRAISKSSPCAILENAHLICWNNMFESLEYARGQRLG